MALPSKNSDLYRRLRLYGFGFLMGILIVKMVYKGKGCQLPGSAKMEELTWQQLQYSAKGKWTMSCCHITENEIKQVFKSGKINYDKSDVRNKPFGKYAIEGPTGDGKQLRIIVADCDTITRLITAVDLGMKADTCDCPSFKGD